jgi:glutamyl-tRNA synthetase
MEEGLLHEGRKIAPAEIMSQNSKPVLRFAPSPTGMLHIGGARTALFNWLYARHTGGQFLLRIEDTDRERSTPEAVDAILNGMKWMGLDWDGDAVFQFARAARHRAVAEKLLAEGKAYKCYATAEELTAMREEQKAAKQPLRYDGRWRDRVPGASEDGKPFVVRLRSPQAGQTIVHDVVLGDVTFDNNQMDDMVLLRSDGTPTYMLAVVVDDADMHITHVIRGADHLNNAARQLQIIAAMGAAIPVYGHLPLINGPDGAKLSKRHGALAVEAYRDMGYLAETMRNYLLRLGWSHGDDEIIPTAQAIAWFNFESIGKSAARMDYKKLDNLNGHYIRETANETLVAEAVAFASRETPPRILTETARGRLLAAMDGLKERAKTLVELVQGAEFLFTDGPRTLDAAADKLLTPDARAALAQALPALEATDWSAPALEAAARNHAEATGLKLGAVAQPLRAALTGKASSPPLFEMLALLGREESLIRLRAYAA